MDDAEREALWKQEREAIPAGPGVALTHREFLAIAAALEAATGDEGGTIFEALREQVTILSENEAKNLSEDLEKALKDFRR